MNVCASLGFKLAAQVVGNSLDIVLKQVHIGEDGVVDALQHIVRGIGLSSRYQIGVVDETVAQRFYLLWRAIQMEMADDIKQILSTHYLNA